MDTNHVKQLFVKFAQALPAPATDASRGNDDTSGHPQPLKGPILVGGNLVLREGKALEYAEMLDNISQIVTRDGTWSRVSIDDLLAESVFHVANAPVVQ